MALLGQQDPAGILIMAGAAVERGELLVGLWSVAERVAAEPVEPFGDLDAASIGSRTHNFVSCLLTFAPGLFERP
jgi:hypothetical protein